MKGTRERVVAERIGATSKKEGSESAVTCHEHVEERHRFSVCPADDGELHEGWSVQLYRESEHIVLRFLALFVAKKEFHQAVESG